MRIAKVGVSLATLTTVMGLAGATLCHRAFGLEESRVGADSGERAFDLATFVAGLQPPSLAEIVASLEPIPPVASLLEGRESADAPADMAPIGDHGSTVHSDEDAEINRLADEGNYARALELSLKQLESRVGASGVERLQVAASLATVSRLLVRARSDYATADPLCREAFAIQRRILGENSLQVVSTMHDLARLCKAKNEYGRAELVYRKALAAARRVVGDASELVADVKNDFAVLLRDLGDYASAEAFFRQALATRRALHGDRHRDVATSLHTLASLLQLKGDYAAAEPLHREGLRLREELLGEAHPLTATSKFSLGLLLYYTGEYATSEVWFRESLAMRRQLLPPDHQDVAAGLNALGVLLRTKGDFVGAEPFYREALAIRRKVYGEAHQQVATSWHNLAGLYLDQGRYDEAERTLREVLAMRQRVLGPSHKHSAFALADLSEAVAKQGRLDEAETLQREALEMRRRLFGEEHPDIVLSLKDLGALLVRRGAFDEAEAILTPSLAMCRRLLGESHHDVAAVLFSLARAAIGRGDLTKAIDWLHDSLSIVERKRSQVIGGERERAAFAGKLQMHDIANTLAMALVRVGKPEEAAEVLERGKARVLIDALARSERNVLAEAREQGARVDPLLDAESAARIELTTAESALSALQQRSDLPRNERAARVDAQTELVTQARRRLAEAEASVMIELRRVWPDTATANVRTIRESLEVDELILSYGWSGDGVVVLVIPPVGGGAVRGEVVCAAGEVEGLSAQVALVRDVISRRDDGSRDKSSLDEMISRLSEALIPPAFRSVVQSAKRIVVLNDGPLAAIPFDLLTSGASRRHPGPLVVYAESGTVYVNRRNDARNKRSSVDRPSGNALVLGNPVFARSARPDERSDRTHLALRSSAQPDARQSAGDGVAIARNRPPEPTAPAQIDELEHTSTNVSDSALEATAVRPVGQATIAESAVVGRDLLASYAANEPPKQPESARFASRGRPDESASISQLDQVRLFGTELATLPGTEKEALALARLVESAGGRADVLLAVDASVGKLEHRVAGKQYLHLATHGLTGSRERVYDACLALTQPAAPTVDDIGFLTLDRLLRQWRGKLKDCELVVLSACDTQRGVRTGDTVMALPWGFFCAGAPRVVASLWQVDDTATTLLMARFYENLLGLAQSKVGCSGLARANMSTLTALSEAKAWLRGVSWAEATALAESHGLLLPNGITRGEVGEIRPVVRTARPFAHPFYWAAFVLVGDPE